jgi:hypothetical protein
MAFPRNVFPKLRVTLHTFIWTRDIN